MPLPLLSINKQECVHTFAISKVSKRYEGLSVQILAEFYTHQESNTQVRNGDTQHFSYVVKFATSGFHPLQKFLTSEFIRCNNF